MNDSKPRSFFENMCRIGTPECAIFSAVVAMALALLFLAVGFWKTVLIALVMLLGAFLGGVKDKKEWIKKTINRLFPGKRAVAYPETNPEIVKAVRRATGSAPQEDEPEETQDTEESDETEEADASETQE